MSISTQIDASKAIRGLQSIEKGIEQAIEETLKKAADSAVEGAQAVVPVVTGALQSSIGIKEQGPNYVVVAADTDYAAAIEFGSGTRPAQPYLGPQADRLQSEGPKMLLDSMRSKIR